jgi:hypothetical protein
MAIDANACIKANGSDHLRQTRVITEASKRLQRTARQALAWRPMPSDDPALALRRPRAARPRHFAGRRGGAGRRLAGTVSRALSRPEMISEATRQRVLAAAERLGYVANGAARALALRKTMTIGALVPRYGGSSFPTLVQALEATLAAHGYTLLLSAPDHAARRGSRHPARLLERGVDALALLGSRAPARTHGAAGRAPPAARADVGRPQRRRRLRHLRRGRGRHAGGRPPGRPRPPPHRLHRRPHRGNERARAACSACCRRWPAAACSCRPRRRSRPTTAFARASRPCRRCCSGARR